MSNKRRKKFVSGSDRFRLSVFKSNTNIYAQIIDDSKGVTIISQSSLKMEFGSTVAGASEVGKLLAVKAAAASVKSVWFDRGGYKYTGRVKALADAARIGGLDF